MLRINDVYNNQGKNFRILKYLSEDTLVWIDIEKAKALPELISLRNLVELIEDGSCYLIDDPFSYLLLESPKEGTTAQIKRDKNFQLIQPVISDALYYQPETRSRLINNIVRNDGCTNQTLYRLIRMYWQRGQVPNALLPNYKNSGAKGKKRIAKNKELGRPRVYKKGMTAVINEDIERLFSIIINKYLLNDKKFPVVYAYRKFKVMYRSLNSEAKEEDFPSIWQFKYFYSKNFTSVQKLKARYNKISYNKDVRQLKSTVNMQVLGPGSRYEIDATIADIYLVSDSDRQSIVGRPVIYFVTDVFSRMVAGFYIGFENPSYATSIQALEMAVSDKQSYCSKYGINITDDNWPCIGLPDAILADRGELLGHQIETLEKNFSVRIENTPPYRGDLKPIVERYFKTMQAKFKPFAPGVVTGVKEKKKGGNDYRLDAALTISDFKKIIINSILMHNNTHQLSYYDRDSDMPADLPLVPIELWNWGIQNRTGRLRSVSAKALYIALLPRKKATFSDLGIKLFGNYYICSEIREHGWLHRKNTINRPKSLEVAYDPLDADTIYIFYEQNSLNYWKAHLSDRSREFKGCSFWEVWQIQEEQKKTAAYQELKSSLALEMLEQENEKIIQEAINAKPRIVKTKADQLANINNNRKKAKDDERKDRRKNKSQQGTLIRLSTRKVDSDNKVDLSDEDLALKFPIYHDILSEDD
ncbi:Transposon Tn7 transposition protein tnsB [Wohlfahrtiimonas chitiniclastica SH04]|uniref:Transposon Tn7 transposition protein tnsB n=1 Tax=Wohlfahrtiimonas chitiniclastica SH04 TaxID=1261130 RepID=L8XYJ6_9GAMM|nr:Mu transposase C-terminal domain-containing protein [Wohlfahrtiimonas chitiniclastica]ELV07889.1 Transposon Tn7 transposition protein tnsB [Wohlfahrtiimonas chitiniclastica SH04]